MHRGGVEVAALSSSATSRRPAWCGRNDGHPAAFGLEDADQHSSSRAHARGRRVLGQLHKLALVVLVRPGCGWSRHEPPGERDHAGHGRGEQHGLAPPGWAPDRSMSGGNPRSSILSASSSTSSPTSERLRSRWRTRSRRRPGVPTTISAPSLSVRSGFVGLAAVKRYDLGRAVLCGLQIIGDLNRQFPGGDDDQGPGVARVRGRLAVQPLQQRDAERQRLARPGPGLADESWPVSAMGRTSAWIGKEAVIPWAARLSQIGRATPRSANNRRRCFPLSLRPRSGLRPVPGRQAYMLSEFQLSIWAPRAPRYSPTCV